MGVWERVCMLVKKNKKGKSERESYGDMERILEEEKLCDGGELG